MSFIIPYRTLTWVEGTEVKSGNADGSAPKIISRPEAFKGDEKSVVYDKPNNKVYTIKPDNNLYQYDPVDNKFTPLTDDGKVTSAKVTPEGQVLYSQSDDSKHQVQFLISALYLNYKVQRVRIEAVI